MPYKPGYKTSEFWASIAYAVLMAALTYLVDSGKLHPSALDAASQGLLQIAASIGCPISGAWVVAQYTQGRPAYKTALTTATCTDQQNNVAVSPASDTNATQPQTESYWNNDTREAPAVDPAGISTPRMPPTPTQTLAQLQQQGRVSAFPPPQ